MNGENKSEKATPRRRQKAREQGQVARSRELVSAASIVAMIAVLVWRGPLLPGQFRDLLSSLLEQSASGQLDSAVPLLMRSAATIAQMTALPMFVAVVGALGAAAGQGGLVFASAALTPKFDAFNPARRLGQVFSIRGITETAKSLLPATAIALISIGVILESWSIAPRYMRSSGQQVLASVGSVALAVGWRCGLVLLVWAGIDVLIERLRIERSLRMSRHELREEAKETEGNPLVKQKIRRMQRQVRRSRMLRDVARASVVVTNPTHYSIALQYDPETTPAPLVLAKGRGLLAGEIRRAAIWSGVPLMENPPLAHALYRAVEVGQMIPARLYLAVAEMLAFLYREHAGSTR